MYWCVYLCVLPPAAAVKGKATPGEEHQKNKWWSMDGLVNQNNNFCFLYFIMPYQEIFHFLLNDKKKKFHFVLFCTEVNIFVLFLEGR